MNLTKQKFAILNAMDESVGWRTGDLTEAANVYLTLGKRIASAWARIDLLELEKLGLVSRLDDQKPVCWIRTKAGTELTKRATASCEAGSKE